MRLLKSLVLCLLILAGPSAFAKTAQVGSLSCGNGVFGPGNVTLSRVGLTPSFVIVQVNPFGFPLTLPLTLQSTQGNEDGTITLGFAAINGQTFSLRVKPDYTGHLYQPGAGSIAVNCVGQIIINP